jgi:phenylpyruvate tautomerase PptA (4-oxalocrotonate tautomerase family)
MPIYQCSTQAGMLNDELKAELSRAVTDAHCELTGAPRLFVHVFFNEMPPGVSWNDGNPDKKISGIQGAVRAGRPLEQRQALAQRLSSDWSRITGQPAKEVMVGINEIVSETQMEYGLLLPKPGDEPKWFSDNAKALDGISGTGL